MHEILHKIKSKRGHNGLIAVKIDMQKAFDHVEWNVISKLLEWLRFAGPFINLTQQCISTATHEILLNGTVAGKFKAVRGLCQGNPFSPFLFILVTELVSRISFKAEELDHIHGIKIARLAPPVSHLTLCT